MDKCIFCNEKVEEPVSFRNKPICRDCFKDIFDWAKHGELRKRIDKIEKVVEKAIMKQAEEWE